VTSEGRVLGGRYRLGRLLGRGGMAEVYEATDDVLQRPVAVKVLGGWLGDDGTFVERFRREALAAARLSHPELVAVYDTGSEDGLHYIVMELVPGETLADALARDGRLEPGRATAIARAVARALAVAHAAGIVHRDVKPANVMLAPDGRARLMDLGIARSLDGEDLTRTTSILGSPNYLSPEQARGERVDARSDLYSLGCVLYEMLAGRPPFDAESPVAVAYKHVHEDPSPPSAFAPVPAGLDAVTLRAMAKDPAERFQTAEELDAALERGTDPIAPTATAPIPAATATTPLPPVEPTRPLPRRRDRPPPRRRWLPLMAAALALAVIGALAFALLGGPEPTTSDRDRSPTPRTSPSPSPSPSSPSPSPSPEPPPAGPVEEAVAAFLALVEEGVSEGRITEKAAHEIEKHLDDAMKKFDEGDTEEAVRKLDELESKIDDFIEKDEILQSEENALDRALEDLAIAMFEAQPPSDEGDGDD
jgi:eukaryotic-like serine/threonine-protein kinase